MLSQIGERVSIEDWFWVLLIAILIFKFELEKEINNIKNYPIKLPSKTKEIIVNP